MKKIFSLIAMACFGIMLASAANPPVSLQFDGSDGCQIDCGTNTAFTDLTTFTVEAWVNFSSTGGGYVLCTESGTGGASGWVLKAENNKIILSIGNGSWTAVVNTSNIVCGKWFHVAATYTTTQSKMYIDGALVATKDFTTPMIFSTKNMLIGEGTEWGNRRFNGKMADVRLWNVVRTAEEIAASMPVGSLTGTETGLVANWKMNENTGDAIADAKGAFNLTKPASVTWTPAEMPISEAPKTKLGFSGNDSCQINVGTDSAFIKLNAFTVEAMVNFSSFDGGYVLSTEANPNGKQSGYVLKVENGKILLSIGNGNWSAVVAKTALTLGTWYHVAASYTPTETKIYINGVLENTLTLTAPMNMTTKPLYIGEGTEWGNRRFRGEMADVRFWNVVRTAEEIAASKGAGALSGNESGLVANWKLDEGRDSLIADATGKFNTSFYKGKLTWKGDVKPYIEAPVTSLKFSGADKSQIDCGVNTAFSDLTAFTVETYVKFTNFDGGYIVCNESGANGASGYVLRTSNGKIELSIGNGNWQGLSSKTAIVLGKWYHVAASCTATQMKLYINGGLEASKDITKAMQVSVKPLIIGEGTEWGGRRLRGELADVRLWNVERTAEEIAASKAAGSLVGNETGLVGNWKFDEGQGISAVDASGKYNVAVDTTILKWVGVIKPFAETPKTRLQFNGVDNSFINCGTNVAFTDLTTFTVEAYVNFSSLDGGYVVCTEANPNNIQSGYVLKAENGKLILSIGNGNWTAAVSTTPIEVGKWYHVAGTYTTTQVKIYINGVLEATKDLTAPMNLSTKPLYIGEGTEWGGRFFRGQMADVRLWNVVRTAEEIAATKPVGSLTGSETGLVANWKMNEGALTNVADATGDFNQTIDLAKLTWVGDITVGIQKNILSADVDILVKGQTLSIVNKTKNSLNFSLFSMAGTKVLDAAVEAGATFTQELTGYNGVFILKGIAADGSTIIKKIVL